MPLRRRFAVALLGLVPLVTAAHPGHTAAGEMARAARAWLDSLNPPQRQRAVFPVEHDERENWHFIPRARQGVPLKDMTDDQRRLARELVAAGLSERGVLTTDAIIALEDVLRVMENSARRDRGLYFFTVFGEPATPATWGWRLEGHHLSVNFLISRAGTVAATPMFFGANPAEVRIEHAQKGRRALAPEEDLARALLEQLDTGQRRLAIIAESAPRDIITGNDREARLAAPTGLAYARMTPPQQARLRALVEHYAGRLRAELAQAELQRIADRGWDGVHFAWAGGTARGEPHYYRVHGPGFVIEYDNFQDGGNHIHTTWRDFTRDFGRDLLREHHLESHPAR